MQLKPLKYKNLCLTDAPDQTELSVAKNFEGPNSHSHSGQGDPC